MISGRSIFWQIFFQTCSVLYHIGQSCSSISIKTFCAGLRHSSTAHGRLPVLFIMHANFMSTIARHMVSERLNIYSQIHIYIVKMSLKPPKPLSFEGNLDENYKVWVQQYTLYALAAGVTEKTENVGKSPEHGHGINIAYTAYAITIVAPPSYWHRIYSVAVFWAFARMSKWLPSCMWQAHRHSRYTTHSSSPLRRRTR